MSHDVVTCDLSRQVTTSWDRETILILIFHCRRKSFEYFPLNSPKKFQLVRLLKLSDLCSKINLTAEWALRALIDFTLSNARRFYSSMGNPLDRKGLKSLIFFLFKQYSNKKFAPRVTKIHRGGLLRVYVHFIIRVRP